MNNTESRSITLYLLIALMLFQGVSGLYGGGALVADPSGEMLKMPLSLLEGSPFETFLYPGIILLVVLGFFPVVVAYGLVRRTSWARTGALLVATALIIWIGVEILMIGYQSDPPLQFIYGSVGIALLILSRLPSIQQVLNPKIAHDEAIN